MPFQKGLIPWNKGRTGVYSEETIRKISLGRIGKKPWNKGLTKETDSRIICGLSGEKNPNWNGGCRRYYQNIAYEVWEDYWNEKIPNGYILHHFDKDFTHNEISNLPMITNSMHEKIHKRNPNRDKKTGRFLSKEA